MSRLNPWFEERLKGISSPEYLSVIVEVDPAALERVRTRLGELPGVSVGRVSFGRFIQVRVPTRLVRELTRLDGVVMVHYDAPVWIRSDPLLVRTDPLLGTVQLSPIEVPRFPAELFPTALLAPAAWLDAATFRIGSAIKDPRVEILPTSETRKVMGVPPDNRIGLTVAVLDTGNAYHPIYNLRVQQVELYSTTGEPPVDGQGHGTWVASCAWGDRLQSRFGLLEGVASPWRAFGGRNISIKCLSNAGFGATSWILQAMEMAVRMGAKVVNMSLGGPLQGSVRDDPMCKAIEATADRVIWCIAAGNDGPKEWTIGSPGASPHALTVGAYSTLYGDVAVFSSRGPQGEYYKKNRSAYNEDLARYGEDLIKPDCLAPGGGPVRDGQRVDLIYSAVVGWSDPIYDLIVDGLGAMRGTSMATPHAAGLVSIAVWNGLVKTAADVKRKLARTAAKDHVRGYGLITYDRLR